jgi:hypothetical protein
MNKHILFLKWWFFATLMTLGVIITYFLNIFHIVWEHDATTISFIILALWAGCSLWCGFATWQVSRGISKGEIKPSTLEKIKYAEDTGWFISDQVLNLGMIGTVAGFIIMLMGGFADVDTSNPESIRVMLSKLSGGMSTALFTTLAGLIACILLKVQYFNLTKGIEKLK